MPAGAPLPVLSLAEYAVLGLVGEGRQHGFALARLLSSEGEVGRVYGVARPAVYRAVERLTEAGLVRPLDVEPGDRGPRRTPLRITPSGRRALDAWLWTPVQHVRQIRTEFLLKVVLVDRAGEDPSPLIKAQIGVLVPVVAAIGQHYQASTGSERTVSLWRTRSAEAALQFLRELAGERASQTQSQRPDQRPAQRPAQRPDQRPSQRPAQRPDQRPDQRPAQDGTSPGGTPAPDTRGG